MENENSISPKRTAWNKGKLIGAKPPLLARHVWSIRTKLQIERRTRDLAMFKLAIDSKLRGCDVVAIKVEDVAPERLRARKSNGSPEKDRPSGPFRIDRADPPNR
jgi:hypothetical protein